MRFLLTTAACLTLLASPAPAADPKGIDFNVVKAFIDRHFATLPGYESGDLICVGDVEPIINALLENDIGFADNEAMYDALLPDNNILVRTLRTPEGRKFMRSVSSLPNVYDRLDRLSWSPAGRAVLSELVTKAEGPELLKVLLAPEGKAIIEQIAGDDVRLKNFDLPTGRVHTVEQFTERLRGSLGKKPRPAKAD